MSGDTFALWSFELEHIGLSGKLEDDGLIRTWRVKSGFSKIHGWFLDYVESKMSITQDKNSLIIIAIKYVTDLPKQTSAIPTKK